MIRFYRLPIIIEAETMLQALDCVNDIERRYSSTTEIWVDGDPIELTKEEVMKFFDYDEKTYKEMVEDF